MPSTKNRINLTVPADIEQTLIRFAKRDDTSVATTALELIRRALEIEEDAALLTIAERRESKRAKTISHAQAWK
ncbi:hypothetical protein KBC54_01560 [Patescibacteria group bacterium]|nr:hypothetical protein [Patescibacteria group bacterium]